MTWFGRPFDKLVDRRHWFDGDDFFILRAGFHHDAHGRRLIDDFGYGRGFAVSDARLLQP
jgi:hypothetical protein